MALELDNSYLIGFTDEEVIGYIFDDDNIFAEKQCVDILKDVSTGKIFRNISKGKIKRMSFANRFFEKLYYAEFGGDFKEITTSIIKVCKADIEIKGRSEWVGLNYTEARKISDNECDEYRRLHPEF